MLQDRFGQFADTKLHATSTMCVENWTAGFSIRYDL